jgi:hypothetical protein
MTTVAEFSEKVDDLISNLEHKVVQATETFDNLASNVENKGISWDSDSIPAFELEFGVLITGGLVQKHLDDFAGKLSNKLSRGVSVVDQAKGRASTPQKRVKVYIETASVKSISEGTPQLIVKFHYSNQ